MPQPKFDAVSRLTAGKNSEGGKANSDGIPEGIQMQKLQPKN